MPNEAGRGQWIFATATCVGGVTLTVPLPHPEPDITSTVAGPFSLEGEGLWVDDPYRAIAFGFLYGVVVGWSELYGRRPFSRQTLLHP